MNFISRWLIAARALLRKWLFPEFELYVVEQFTVLQESMKEVHDRQEEFLTQMTADYHERLDLLARSTPFKELHNDSIATMVGAIQNVVDSHTHGQYGGMISLRNLRPYESVELALYTYTEDGLADRYLVFTANYEDVAQQPAFGIPEFWAPYGAKVVLSQHSGQSRVFPYSIYCK